MISNRTEGSLPVDAGAVTSTAIAAYLDGEHRGSEVTLTGIDSLDAANESDLAFCVYDRPDPVRDTDAGAVICSPRVGSVNDTTQIVVSNPRLGFARAATAAFASEERSGPPEIHESAAVHEDAEIGEGTRIGPHVRIGPDVQIGPRCIIRAGTVVGGAGFGFERDDAGTPHRLPHQGAVRIGAEVEIGPNCSIDRAVFDETLVRAEAKLSAGVHVAHQVTIGPGALVAFGAGFGGGAAVGEAAMIHPQATVAEGISVGPEAEVGMNSTVLEDVPAGRTVAGSPAQPIDRTDDDRRDGDV